MLLWQCFLAQATFSLLTSGCCCFDAFLFDMMLSAPPSNKSSSFSPTSEPLPLVTGVDPAIPLDAAFSDTGILSRSPVRMESPVWKSWLYSTDRCCSSVFVLVLYNLSSFCILGWVCVKRLLSFTRAVRQYSFVITVELLFTKTFSRTSSTSSSVACKKKQMHEGFLLLDNRSSLLQLFKDKA